MSEELMPCPICGDTVELAGPSNPDASRDVVWPNCVDDSCPYILDGGDPARMAAVHNTLARQARVGQLVENLLQTDATYTAHLSLDYEVKPDKWKARRAVADRVGESAYGRGRPSAFGSEQGPTLLAALESLAAALEVKDGD